MIRVAIANDTLIALEALRRVIATNTAYELIWTARDGIAAVEQCARNSPDLILMDLSMPGLDGVEATRRIMERSPCAILIVTASVNSNTSQIFEAMGYGALDVVSTPVLGPALAMGTHADDTIANSARPLLAKMATVSAFIGKSVRQLPEQANVVRSSAASVALTPLIVIGASTGGPKALAHILRSLPSALNAAIVIVQHIAQQFSKGLTDWLNQQSELSVRVAKMGDRIVPGQVLIASTDHHLIMRSDRSLAYVRAKRHTVYHPSVDVFFESVARHWPQAGQAVLLTGMGRDGACGLRSLQSAGWQTIAESEASCVVYGMPRAAVALGAAERVLPVSAIAQSLLDGLVLSRISGV
ncbi:MAG: chemotaxis-specific protein-glutamate methyltransferase CheB [Cyanobacteria bacterium J06631_9]